MRSKTFYLKTFIFIILALTIFTTIAVFVSHAAIRTITGTVTKVSDGDSIQVTTPEQTNIKVRLYGIDAPETPKINHHTGRVNKPGNPMARNLGEP